MHKFQNCYLLLQLGLEGQLLQENLENLEAQLAR
jgi:hypothetical protein